VSCINNALQEITVRLVTERVQLPVAAQIELYSDAHLTHNISSTAVKQTREKLEKVAISDAVPVEAVEDHSEI